MKFSFSVLAGGALLACLHSPASRASAVVFSDTGTDLVEIQDTIEAFQVAASETGGTAVDHGVGGGSFGTGLRHIDWDTVPTTQATPNRLPGDSYYNDVPVGAGMFTLGTGLRVSALPGEGLTLRFGDLEPSYATTFAAYGDHRLFAPIDSTVTDIRFFVPDSPTHSAVVNGFGAIFADVDDPLGMHPTLVEYWDINGQLLGHFEVPANDNGLSFLGVYFDGPEQVARVRINSGNIPLVSGVDDGLGGVVDMVAMGQFFYSEPIAVPEPTPWVLLVGGLATLLVATRRTRAQAGASGNPPGAGEATS